MKQIIYILMFAVMAQMAIAVYGGEEHSYVFENCNDLVVNITANKGIDEGEYSVLSDCTETSNNSYSCDCEDNYIFNMNFAVNTVNHYTLTSNQEFVYYVDDGVVESSGGASSGSSGGSSVAAAKEIAVKINDKQTKVSLSQGKTYNFSVGNNIHTMKVDKLYMNKVTITIESEPQTATLYVKGTQRFNLDSGVIEVTLQEIRGGAAVFMVEKIEKEDLVDDVTIERDLTAIEETQVNGTAKVTVQVIEGKLNPFVVYGVPAFGFLVLIGLVLLFNKKRKQQEENENENKTNDE